VPVEFSIIRKCHSAMILKVLSDCSSLFDVFCKRSINFITRCLASDNAVVSFVVRHGIHHGRMMSCVGRNLQFCCCRYKLHLYDLVSRPNDRCKFIDKYFFTRFDTDVYSRVDIIRQLVMVRDRLSVLSDNRFSHEDVCSAIEHLCVE